MKEKILNILIHTSNSTTWGELAEQLTDLFQKEKTEILFRLLGKMEEARSKAWGFKIHEEDIDLIFDEEMSTPL